MAALRLIVASLLFTCAFAKILYPAGVNPAHCFNYPWCDPLVDPTTGNQVAPASDFPGYVPFNLKYPAGLNPGLCIDYPYCTGREERLVQFVKTGRAEVPAGISRAAWLA